MGSCKWNMWAFIIDIHLLIFANNFVMDNRAALRDDTGQGNAIDFATSAETANLVQNAQSAILHDGVDNGHHNSFAFLHNFYFKMFWEMREGWGKVIKLDVGK